MKLVVDLRTTQIGLTGIAFFCSEVIVFFPLDRAHCNQKPGSQCFLLPFPDPSRVCGHRGPGEGSDIGGTWWLCSLFLS